MDEWSDPNLGKRLHDLIANREPGLPFRSALAPALAYGRHSGPANGLVRRRLRQAAVLIGLMMQDDQWVIPLTLRPMTLSHHAGQICLPGGQIETGETRQEAAFREYHEELGIAPAVRFNCGELSPQYVFGSDHCVHPVVVVLDSPQKDWSPDPIEVEEILTLPLRTLMNPESRTVIENTKSVRQVGKQVDQLTFSAPAIECGNHVIWGATAMILDELAQLLHY